MESLEILGKLLYNATVAPKEEKFRRIRLRQGDMTGTSRAPRVPVGGQVEPYSPSPLAEVICGGLVTLLSMTDK